MMAVRTTITAEQLPDSLKNLRRAIEQAVPHGRTHQVPSLTRNLSFTVLIPYGEIGVELELCALFRIFY